MNIICCGKTDIGLKRKNNEDAYLVRPDLGFFAVADGVGGAASGEIASRIFVDTAQELIDRKAPCPEDEISALIQNVFRQANERILADAATYPEHGGMACTAELITFSANGYILGHVGDSRTYLFRKGELRQITRDHSLVQDQVDKGLITPEEAKKHSLRNVLLRALGAEQALALDLVRGKILPDDIFLLCSDGLTNMVENVSMQEVLASTGELADKVDRLIESAKTAGGSDNITVVLCQVPSL